MSRVLRCRNAISKPSVQVVIVQQVFELGTLLSDMYLAVLTVANTWPSLFGASFRLLSWQTLSVLPTRFVYVHQDNILLCVKQSISVA